MNKLPDTNCDVCRKNKCTRWYGQTSAVLCDDHNCYERINRDFIDALIEMEKENED